MDYSTQGQSAWYAQDTDRRGTYTISPGSVMQGIVGWFMRSSGIVYLDDRDTYYVPASSVDLILSINLVSVNNNTNGTKIYATYGSGATYVSVGETQQALLPASYSGYYVTVKTSPSSTGANYAIYNLTTWQAPDATPPTISLSTDKSRLGIGETAVIAFTLSESSTNFDLGDITVSGGTLTNFSGNGLSYTALFTPTTNSTASGLIIVDIGVFTDFSGNANTSSTFLSLAVNTTQDDTTPPNVLTFRPSDDTTGVPVDSSVALNFNEAIALGSGIIEIRSGSVTGTIAESFNVATSTRLTLSDTTLMIDPTSDLSTGTQYFVLLPSGVIKDTAGNSYIGTSTYDFTTNFIPIASAAAITTKEDTARVATLVGTDTDNNALTYAKVSDPSHGTVTIDAQTGAYSYTPALNYYGTDSFSFKVNDGTVDSPAATVFIIVTAITDITGQVYHWKNHALLQGVQIVDGTTSTTTESNGIYHLDATNSTSDLLVPTLTSQNTGAAVDSADALAALKLAVGLNPNANGAAVSPYQFIAADVNEDGEVNSADALAILKMSVNRPDAPAAKWHFVNESEDLWDEAVKSFTTTRKNVTFDKSIDVNTQSDVNVNLVAVLKGDVNGSWGAGVSASTLDTLNPNYFSELSSRLGMPQSQWGLVV